MFIKKLYNKCEFIVKDYILKLYIVEIEIVQSYTDCTMYLYYIYQNIQSSRNVFVRYIKFDCTKVKKYLYKVLKRC